MTPSPLATWHEVVRTRNTAALKTLLADDCVFHSPVVHTPKVGKALTYQYLSAALKVFLNDSFHYVREIDAPLNAILEFQVVIDGITVNGVDMMTWNEAGQIVDFKVMIRPLKAVNLIHQAMEAMLVSASLRPGP